MEPDQIGPRRGIDHRSRLAPQRTPGRAQRRSHHRKHPPRATGHGLPRPGQALDLRTQPDRHRDHSGRPARSNGRTHSPTSPARPRRLHGTTSTSPTSAAKPYGPTSRLPSCSPSPASASARSQSPGTRTERTGGAFASPSPTRSRATPASSSSTSGPTACCVATTTPSTSSAAQPAPTTRWITGTSTGSSSPPHGASTAIKATTRSCESPCSSQSTLGRSPSAEVLRRLVPGPQCGHPDEPPPPKRALTSVARCRARRARQAL